MEPGIVEEGVEFDQVAKCTGMDAQARGSPKIDMGLNPQPMTAPVHCGKLLPKKGPLPVDLGSRIRR